MKCPYCGGNLTLEMEVCPHCGKKNIQAKEHIAARKHYRADYEATREEVERTNKKLSGYAVRGILIAILTVTLVVLLFVSANVERSYYEKKQAYAVDHYEEILPQMLELWEGEQYYSFYSYCDSYHLTGWTASDQPYLKWMPLMTAAGCYEFSLNHLDEYLTAEDVYKRNQALEDLCGVLAEFYSPKHLGTYASIGGVLDEELTMPYIEEIYDHMDRVLQTYLGLSEEEAASLRTLDESGMLLLMEERSGNEQ